MKTYTAYITLGLTAMLLWITPVRAANFNIDPQNSVVVFKMDNLEGYTAGAFGLSGGTVELSEDSSKVTALSFDVDVASVNTESALRDDTLRGPLFFDVAKFPAAKYTATASENGKVSGNLTLKGVTKPVVLDYVVKDKVVELRGAIKRKDFGIDLNRLLEKNKALLGDTVEVAIQLNTAGQ